MEIKEIRKTLKKSGIKSGDTLMLHGDAGIAAEINSTKKNKLKIFFDEIIKYLGKNGTLLVPTFTYSSCHNEIFNIKKTPSNLGLFSENFRKRKNVRRTSHPIFSFSIYGKKYKYFEKAKIETCFGKNSIFELFRKVNGKILCAGCSFNRITFIHYAEEIFGVKYRFFKNFVGLVRSNKQSCLVKTEYFVRKLNCRSRLNLKYFYQYLLKRGNVFSVNFGRYSIHTVEANVLLNNCLKVLKKNKNFLVKK